MKQPKFTILQSKDKQWYFVLRSPNGKIIATGETYKSKQGCKKAIFSVYKNAKIAYTLLVNSPLKKCAT